LTSSGAGISGRRIGDDCDWVDSCRPVGSEPAKTLVAVDTAFVAVARALTSSVSDSVLDPDLDLGPIVWSAQPAF
jgi:hypothetical protein